MKLKKSLYVFWQSSKNRFSTIDHHLGKIRFRSLKSDPCVYVYEVENGSATLTFYVDDVLLLGANKRLLDKLNKQLINRFEMTTMGDVSRVLGMNVTRDHEEGTITINQKDYTEDIVQRYGMRGCNLACTPGVGAELSLDQSEENLLNKGGKRRYQSVTGTAMYFAQVCRYDILYTVIQLARAMSKPSKAHLRDAKRLLRYLARSTDFSITYKKGGFKLTAFSTRTEEQTPTTEVYVIIHHDAFQRPDQLQGGHSRINCTAYNGGGIGGGGAHHEGAVFYSNMRLKLGFKEGFDSVPLYIDNT